jgi:Na+/proline symporter
MPLSALGSSILLAVLLVYILALGCIGRFAGRNIANADDFLLAGRNVPLGLSVLSLLGTWFGSSAILGATRSSYEFGLAGTVLEPFACAATLALTGLLFAGPLWRLQVSTVADLFRARMGSMAEWISCVIQVPTFFCWIGAQYLSIGALLETYLGVPGWVGAVASCIVVLFILWTGGMWAVTWTNSLLVALAIGGVVILFLGTARTLGDGSILYGVQRVWAETPRERLAFFPDGRVTTILGTAGIFFTGLFGNIPGQDLQQRVLCSRSPRVAVWSCLICSVLYLAVGLIPVYVGLAARIQLFDKITEAHVQGDQVLSVAAPYFLNEPLVIVLVIGLISVNLAVAASATISQTTILDRNVLRFLKRKADPSTNYEKGCVIAVSIGSMIAAFSGESVMGLLELSLVLVMVSLFVPMCVCLFAKNATPRLGIASMIAGLFFWGCHGMIASLVSLDPIDSSGTQTRWQVFEVYLAVPSEIQGLAASTLVASLFLIRYPRLPGRVPNPSNPSFGEAMLE